MKENNNNNNIEKAKKLSKITFTKRDGINTITQYKLTDVNEIVEKQPIPFEKLLESVDKHEPKSRNNAELTKYVKRFVDTLPQRRTKSKNNSIFEQPGEGEVATHMSNVRLEIKSVVLDKQRSLTKAVLKKSDSWSGSMQKDTSFQDTIKRSPSFNSIN